MPREDLEEWADRKFLTDPRFRKKRTFGCPSYCIGAKMFAFVYDDGLGIKLPPERVLEKIADDAAIFFPFHPGDGVMKNWLIIVRPEASEYAQDEALIDEALAAFA